MAQKDPSRTEKATEKRRNKSREKGSVPKSQEAGKVTSLLVGTLVVWACIGILDSRMREIYEYFLQPHNLIGISPNGVYKLFLEISTRLAIMLLPIFFTLALAMYLTMRLQVGSLWTTKVFKPKLSKHLNLLAGIKRLFFDIKVLVRLLKQLLMATIIGLVPYFILKEEMTNFLPLFYFTAEGTVAYILTVGLKMVIYALIPMIVLAAADIIYTRWNYEEELKMTKDEIKDERKQSEGDPLIKSKQRMKMFEVTRRRMLQAVPNADVIITNPEHIAVALQYNPIVAPAPIVVAKGADHMAKKIREIAKEHSIPIKENKPLARALYKSVDIGDIIPEELYQAVATMLAQLDKFRKQAPKKGPKPSTAQA